MARFNQTTQRRPRHSAPLVHVIGRSLRDVSKRARYDLSMKRFAYKGIHGTKAPRTRKSVEKMADGQYRIMAFRK
jgi:hypothetical protein